MPIEVTARLPPIPSVIEALWEGCTLANLEYLKLHPATPPLALLARVLGIRYQFELPGNDVWFIPDILAQRRGACGDLSPWRAAELRFRGIDPGARVRVYKSAPELFHAIVGRTGGWFEDPSRALGMKG